MEIIEGNILDVSEGIIVHQVNCKKKMGAGLALQIKKKYPKVFNDYVNHLEMYEGMGRDPLGSINSTSCAGVIVYNFYAQSNYGRNGVQTDYNAFEKCLKELEKRFENSKIEKTDIPVYFPYGIGCGLAGGYWPNILELINKYFPDAKIIKFTGEL